MTDKKQKDEPEKKAIFIPPNAFSIYSDGSYRPDGNASCAYLIFSEKTKHIVKMERFVFRGRTINQMELEAVNKALDHKGMDYVIIYSDSVYTISSLTLWRKAWERNNWITPAGTPVKNKELIQEIAKKMDAKKFVRFVKVKAHSGDPFNSVVDYQAASLSDEMRDNPSLKDGSYPCR